MNNCRNIFLILTSFLFANFSFAVEMGIPVQLKLKAPDGSYPSESGLNVKVMVLSPSSNCILREEDFSGVSISNGALSVTLGSGVRGSNDPNLTLNQVYNNSSVKSGLSCVDSNNNIISIAQTFTPAATDQRIIRVATIVSSESIIANFNMRSTPYAIQAESVGGLLPSSILTIDITTQLNQTNLADLLFDSTRFNNLKSFAISGQAPTAVSATTATSATTAASATNFTGSLAGDISGTQSAVSVDKIKGVAISATAPTNGQILQYDGSQYVPVAIPADAVTSVAGRTGVVTLASADISGLGTAAGLNVGVAANNVVQLNGSATIPDSTLPSIALTTSSAFSGDISGTNSTISVDKIKGTAVNATAPTTGQALVYNGSSWIPTTGFPSFAKSTANQTFAVTGLADVTNLSFAVTSGITYKFKFNVIYTSAATTTGIRLGLTIPAVTSASAAVNIPSGADGTAAFFQGIINSSGDSVMSTASPVANTVHFATVEGLIVPSASGTVQLRAASEINASNIIIRAGSYVEVIQVP